MTTLTEKQTQELGRLIRIVDELKPGDFVALKITSLKIFLQAMHEYRPEIFDLLECEQGENETSATLKIRMK